MKPFDKVFLISIHALVQPVSESTWPREFQFRQGAEQLMANLALFRCALIWDWSDFSPPEEEQLNLCHNLMTRFPQIVQAHVSVNRGVSSICTWFDEVAKEWRNIPNYPRYENITSETPYSFPDTLLLYSARDSLSFLPDDAVFIGTVEKDQRAAKQEQIEFQWAPTKLLPILD